jgi:hypothetical protein
MPRPQYDSCVGQFVGQYSDGQQVEFYINRIGGNQVSVQLLVGNQWTLQGNGTCDMYQDGQAELSVNINGDQHDATINGAIMNGQDADGYTFSAYRR